MVYDGIFFDLDGTLLPMDNDEFTRCYFGYLLKAVAPFGYKKETFIPAMWQSVGAMVKNDGKCSNENAFWESFGQLLGKQVYEHKPVFDEFYRTDFDKAIISVQPRPDMARRVVAMAREKADCVVLATNPIFPRIAVEKRLAWAGLKPEAFDLVTDYENSGTCKPNPEYYREICGKLALNPEKCLMIGNNAQEDVEASRAAGLSQFLLTDCLINSAGDLPDCPHGSFEELIKFLENL